MNYHAIIESAAKFVKGFMREHENPHLIYHKLDHTEKVVDAVTKISHHYNLNETDRFICTVAAWFHDIGYYEDMALHEQAGARRAGDFLKDNLIDDEIIMEIKGCILATRLPQTPTNLLEKIVCDADLYHFGTDDFPTLNRWMHKEMEALHNLHINKAEWDRGTVRLLENHGYHTRYCQKSLASKKNHNLAILRKKLGKLIAC